MGVRGSSDGFMHVKVDGVRFSYPSITHAEAATMNAASM